MVVGKSDNSHRQLSSSYENNSFHSFNFNDTKTIFFKCLMQLFDQKNEYLFSYRSGQLFKCSHVCIAVLQGK